MGFVLLNTEIVTFKGKLPEPVARLDEMTKGRIPFKTPRGYTANLDILQDNAYGGGFFDNPEVDDDGVFRRVPLLQEYDGQLHESLALALTRAALGSPAIELVVETDESSNELFLEWVKLGELAIPVDDEANVLVPYIGKQKSFTYIPAIDVLNKTAKTEDLKGKIAIFGTAAPGLLDLRTTPLEASYPGVEIHANIIQGILDQRVMHKPGYTTGFEFLLLTVLGLILTFLLPMLSALWGIIISLSMVSLLIASNLMAWNQYRTGITDRDTGDAHHPAIHPADDLRLLHRITRQTPARPSCSASMYRRNWLMK